MIPKKVLEQHITVLGKTRSGKSSVMRGFVEGLLDDEEPVAIVDPKGDWWGLKLARDGRGPGYPVVIFGGGHADVPINERAGAHVAELFATGNRPCLIDLGGWMPGERTRFWIDFASSLFRHTKGKRWLAIDEVHNFAPKGKIMDPDSGKALHWANRLASEGLGKGIHLIFASQRPQKVHNDTLTSAETLIAMRVLHPSDRAAVSDWIKGCGDAELGAQVLNSLAQMARGEGWAWSPEIGFGPKRVSFPMFKTYDSFRPQSDKDAKSLKGWAEVDLEEVKTRLQAVVKEAEANDPKALKAEIARLKRDAGAVVSRIPADPAEIEAARFEGFRRGKIEGYGDALRSVHAEFAKAAAAVEGAHDAMKAAATNIDKWAKSAPTAPSAPRPAPKPAPVIAPRPRPTRGAGVKIIHDELSEPQQRILDALAWLESIGVGEADRVRAAMLADQSPRSSSFEKNISTLSGKKLIFYPTPGLLRLTDEGRGAANKPDRAPTTAELHAAIRAKISEPQWRLLGALIHVYPEALARDAAAGAAGQSSASSSYEKNVSTLKGLGLIDYPQRGQMAAAPLLFLEGA